MHTKVKIVQVVLRMFCAVILLSVGFAHRMPMAFATDSQSQAYALPDGTFADLCSVSPGQKPAKPLADCEACRLTAAVTLPVPCDESWLISRVASVRQTVPCETPIRSGHRLDRLRLRGPPLSV